MKTRTILCAVALLCLELGGAAYAQGNFNVENNTVPQEWTNRAQRDRDRDGARDRNATQDRRGVQNRDQRSDHSRGDRPGYRAGDRSAYPRGDRPAYGPGYQRGNGPGYQRGDGPGYQRGDGPGYDGRRGAGPDHSFYRGGRLPPEYRSHYYVVDDWHGHHLGAPPRGYHWIQTGSDYVLVAIATGLIAQILLSN
jgi:Ni/Co efflux regulator RcnB